MTVHGTPLSSIRSVISRRIHKSPWKRPKFNAERYAQRVEECIKLGLPIKIQKKKLGRLAGLRTGDRKITLAKLNLPPFIED